MRAIVVVVVVIATVIDALAATLTSASDGWNMYSIMIV